MLIFAFESSAKPASVAVFDDEGGANANALWGGGGSLLGQHFQNCGFSHSRTLLAMAEALLSGLGLSVCNIGLFAVAIGPGSFTGVRIGVSVVKGLAFGLDAPVCGVSTLEAMAHQCSSGDGFSDNAIICPVMDARRGQVYNALFTWDDCVLTRLTQDRAISVDDLVLELGGIDKPFMPLGDGADLILSRVAGGNFKVMRPSPLVKLQSAYGVALASLQALPVSAAELEPVYLRPSQAERTRADAAHRVPTGGT